MLRYLLVLYFDSWEKHKNPHKKSSLHIADSKGILVGSGQAYKIYFGCSVQVCRLLQTVLNAERAVSLSSNSARFARLFSANERCDINGLSNERIELTSSH